MKTRSREIAWLIAGMISLSFLAWFLRTIPPKEGSVIAIGIVLIVLTAFCFLQFGLNNVRRAGLISGGLGIVLFLRLINLAQPLNLLLLTALLVSLELAFQKR